MTFHNSLRFRLLVLILSPLLIVATLAVGWQYRGSTASSEAVFDQKLSIIALAIYRDLIVTQGENLSANTKTFFEEASGSSFFYHVSGPDGGFVNGYSPPPRANETELVDDDILRFFDSTHRGQDVSVVQLRQIGTVDRLTGQVIVTVWQNKSERMTFAQGLAFRGAVIAVLLIGTVAIVVFFGIRLGLSPLGNLEDALKKRSSSDLSPIMRRVPQEVRHIVMVLNSLFQEVTKTQSQKDNFISNAAHQLRNPIAALTSMAQVAYDAKTLKEARARITSLMSASQDLAHLTEQMLSFERLQHQNASKECVLLSDYIQGVATRIVEKYMHKQIEISFALDTGATQTMLDPIMLEQAVTNLVDNAVRHGGDTLDEIAVSAAIDQENLVITIANNGLLINAKDVDRLFERFIQGDEGKGSGLGLSIVQQVAQQHDGSVHYQVDKHWPTFIITIPLETPLAE